MSKEKRTCRNCKLLKTRWWFDYWYKCRLGGDILADGECNYFEPRIDGKVVPCKPCKDFFK